MKKYLLLLFSLVLLFSCKEKTENEPFAPASYTITGKVEKGPFVRGTTITLQPLDSKLNVMGTVFPATIADDEGSFDFGALELDAPYALLTANGYFYDEVSGRLSFGPITLQAIADLSDNATVNVNVLTHLKKERIKKLVRLGRSFAEANQEAQAELLTNFALQMYTQTDVSRFSITAGTDEAAGLLLVSSALLKNRSEAELTESLAKLSKELTENGRLLDDTKEDYRRTAMTMNLEQIAQNVTERYEELGKTVTVKDLNYFIDWDNNGIAGDELGEPGVTRQLEFETKELTVPTGGGAYGVKIKANIPYTFTNPIGGGDETDEQNFRIFNIAPVSYEKDVEQNIMTLEIAPAPSMLMEKTSLTLYSMDGKLSSTLLITQKGDESKIENLLTSDGKKYVTSYLGNMAVALSYLHSAEGVYAKSYKPTGIWTGLQHPPVLPSDQSLFVTWGKCYRALTSGQQIVTRMDTAASALMTPYLTCLDVALYYEMAVMWDKPVYAQGVGEDALNKSPQLSTRELFFALAEKLKPGLIAFADKKNEWDNLDGFLFVSKDVARALLAKMYLYNKEYSKASVLLTEIVRTGHYQLEETRSAAMLRNSREMIYGFFPLGDGSASLPFSFFEAGDAFLPSTTYTEVLLSLAECAYYSGDQPMADDYLNQVLKKREIIPSAHFMASLQKAWTSELKGTGTYFAFLKRNGLALSLLNLKEYMLLLPFPQHEIELNPTMKQNPGY